MRINAKEVFGTRRLNIEETTSVCAAKLPLFTDGHVEIDFSGCVLDYPATSIICDEVLKRLDSVPVPRALIFVFDIDFAERVFLKSFFFGSARLKLECEKATEEEIKTNLKAALLGLNATLTLRIIDPEHISNPVLRTFAYGS